MKSTIVWPASWIAGLSSATTAAGGGGEADGEHDPVDKGVAALLAANALGCLKEPEEERVEHGGHLLHALDGLGEKAKEAVGEQEHEHGKQWGDRRMHGEVGAVGGALEVAVLLGTRLGRLLAKEVQVGALLRRQEFSESGEGRLALPLGRP